MAGERVKFIEAVMMEGCPHCGDGIPKIVTFLHNETFHGVHFVGDWEEAHKAAVTRFGQMRIISCRPIESAEIQEGVE
jgi:hypothetical protein